MSRLDSFIRRLSAQRDCLNQAVKNLTDVPGVIFELGLGNGRTFDHLREMAPQREIYVFERSPAAHPASMPRPEYLVVGDLYQTLPLQLPNFAHQVALVHADIGSGDPVQTAELAKFLSVQLKDFIAPGGMVLSDQPFDTDQWQELALPPEVPAKRYFWLRPRD